jgi:hypothetical protein
MINLKTLLSRNNLIEGILFPLFILSACGEPEKPTSYIARVNDSYLTESDLAELTDSLSVSEKSKSSIIKNWVKQEILYQEAIKQGLADTKEFKRTIENTKRQLASAMVLDGFSASSKPVYSDKDLENFYKETQTSFRLPFNSYYFNRIDFSDRETAVKFRTELILNGWNEALNKFAKDTCLVNISNGSLIAEQDIYPVRLLRILEGLYPLEISIVIPDERGYYSVVQLLDKYSAQAIPPFEAVKQEVENRYKSALIELALENYVNDLYSKNEVEINK